MGKHKYIKKYQLWDSGQTIWTVGQDIVDNTYGYFAFGIVKRIVKGKDHDEVYMDLGRKTEKLKRFDVELLKARKQVYTLKISQWAIVVGFLTKRPDRYFVQAFFPSYVPTIHDRQDLVDSGEFQAERMEAEQEANYVDCLTVFENLKKEKKENE